MRTVDKLHRKVKKYLPEWEGQKFKAKQAEIQAIYERMSVPELRELVLGFEDGTLARERFNELWVAAGGKAISIKEWEEEWKNENG